jgi:predicted enzyme related to lactoylglutathione lyase
MGNPVTQWQVITHDPGKHSDFYATVFGWKVNADNPLGYRMVDPDSAKGIPGGFWPAPPESPAFIQLFIEVTDIQETVRLIIANGGTVLIPPQTIPQGEQMAILRDPMGISFGLVMPAAK